MKKVYISTKVSDPYERFLQIKYIRIYKVNCTF